MLRAIALALTILAGAAGGVAFAQDAAFEAVSAAAPSK
jgi:hypothetical protein